MLTSALRSSSPEAWEQQAPVKHTTAVYRPSAAVLVPDTGMHKRGVKQTGALLTVLLSCALMACGLGLGFVLVSDAWDV